MIVRKGMRFRVHGADSKGTVQAVTSRAITYFFDHDRETLHLLDIPEFTRLFFQPAPSPIGAAVYNSAEA